MKLLKQGGLDRFPLEPEDAVNVMTVHQAKGLEFPVVVVGAAMEGRFPCRCRRSCYEIPAELTKSGPPEVSDTHTVDERKLFYVAATRARDLLIIGTSDIVNKRGGGPSRFIGEMLGTDLNHVLQRSQSSLESGVKVQPAVKGASERRQRLSFRQMALFLQCPLRYKYIVLEGMELPTAEYLYFGNNVHRALDDIHRRVTRGDIPSEGDISLVVEAAWILSPRFSRDKQTHLKAAAKKQIARYLREYQHTLERIRGSELAFAFDFERTVISGRIDLLRQQTDRGAEIVDFKTTESRKGFPEQTEFQLNLYALGATRDLGLEVTLQTVHFLSDSVERSYEWTEARKVETQKLLGSILDQIQAERFEPRHEYCPNCDEFRGICPYYQVFAGSAA